MTYWTLNPLSWIVVTCCSQQARFMARILTKYGDTHSPWLLGFENIFSGVLWLKWTRVHSPLLNSLVGFRCKTISPWKFVNVVFRELVLVSAGRPCGSRSQGFLQWLWKVLIKSVYALSQESESKCLFMIDYVPRKMVELLHKVAQPSI